MNYYDIHEESKFLIKNLKLILAHMLSQINLDETNFRSKKSRLVSCRVIGKRNESVVSWSLSYADISRESTNLVINYKVQVFNIALRYTAAYVVLDISSY